MRICLFFSKQVMVCQAKHDNNHIKIWAVINENKNDIWKFSEQNNAVKNIMDDHEKSQAVQK